MVYGTPTASDLVKYRLSFDLQDDALWDEEEILHESIFAAVFCLCQWAGVRVRMSVHAGDPRCTQLMCALGSRLPARPARGSCAHAYSSVLGTINVVLLLVLAGIVSTHLAKPVAMFMRGSGLGRRSTNRRHSRPADICDN